MWTASRKYVNYQQYTADRAGLGGGGAWTMQTLLESWRRGGMVLQRLSPRERTLLTGLALVALAFVPLRAAEWSQAAFARLAAATAERESARLAKPGPGGSWLERQVAEERRRVAAWSWAVPSTAVGPLMLEERLAGLAERAGLADVRTEAAPEVETVGGAPLARIEVQARFDGAALDRFVQALGETGKGFLIEQLSVEEQEAGAPRLRMTLRLPLAVAPLAAP